LRLGCIKVQEGDGRKLPVEFQEAFGKVLVDAPCSGTGVLRRRADLRWHKTPEELVTLPKLQLEILTSAARAVVAGGVLVYSTCSLEPEENLEVVNAFLASRPDFRLADMGPSLENIIQESTLRQGFLQLYPHKHKVDGFFLARLERHEEGTAHG